MVQLLAPLLNSQHFLIEELKTAYRSVTCQNGFVFVFAEVCPVVFFVEKKVLVLSVADFLLNNCGKFCTKLLCHFEDS